MEIVNSQNLTVLQQFNQCLNKAGNTFAEYVVVPTIQHAYRGGVTLIARTAGCFSRSFEESTRQFARDPFSTLFLLRVSQPLEQLSKRVAQRKPTEFRLFHFLDQAAISHMQHLYLFLHNVNKLLELPLGIKQFVKNASLDNVITRSAQLGGRIFISIDSMRLRARKIVLTCLHYLVIAIDLFVQYMLLIPDLEVFRYLIDVVALAKDRIHGKFADHALEAIEGREREAREVIVANVTGHTLEYLATLISRLSLKGFLGIRGYFVLEQAARSSFLNSTTPLQVGTALVTTYLMWKNVVQPYLAEYYDSYCETFNPNDSRMKEFLNRFSLGVLEVPLEGAKKFFL